MPGVSGATQVPEAKSQTSSPPQGAAAGLPQSAMQPLMPQTSPAMQEQPASVGAVSGAPLSTATGAHSPSTHANPEPHSEEVSHPGAEGVSLQPAPSAVRTPRRAKGPKRPGDR